MPVTDTSLEHADELLVMSAPMLVAAIDDVMATKLLALNEDSIDLKQLLQIARALREQIGWAALRRRTDQSAYAIAFFTLLEQLGVVDAADFEGADELPAQALPAQPQEGMDAPSGG